MLHKNGTECVCVTCGKPADPGDPPLCAKHKNSKPDNVQSVASGKGQRIWSVEKRK
jgi:hypothetical protein